MIKCELGYPYFHALIVVSCVFSLYVQYLFYQLFYCCCRYSSTRRLCLRFSSVRVCFIQGRLCQFTLFLSASHACAWRHLNPWVFQPCQPIFSYLRAVPICLFWVGDCSHFAFTVHLNTCRFLYSKKAHMRPCFYHVPCLKFRERNSYLRCIIFVPFRLCLFTDKHITTCNSHARLEYAYFTYCFACPFWVIVGLCSPCSLAILPVFIGDFVSPFDGELYPLCCLSLI